MRKRALLATTAAALIATPIALAVNATQGLKVGVAPSKSGTKKHPKTVKLSVVTTTTPKDNTPFATRQAVLYFDKNLRFNPKHFKHCSKAALDASGPTVCPKGSKVGNGSATGLALGQQEKLTVTAFNGPGGNKIELYVQGSAPLAINSTIEATLKDAKAPYGKRLIVPIPESLQQPLQGVYATLTRFETNVYAFTRVKGKKVGYVTTVGCSKKLWRFKGDFTYTDGSVQNASATVKCA